MPGCARPRDLRVQALEALRPRDSIVPGPSVDQQIAVLFPTWTRLSTVRGFLPLAKSLRTAEVLYATMGMGPQMADGDPSASIVLWTKSLEDISMRGSRRVSPIFRSSPTRSGS